MYQVTDKHYMQNLMQEMAQSSVKIKDNSLITVTSAKELRSEIENVKDLVPLYEPYFYEGECSILFSDTNTGKSILSVQIADEISRKGYRVLYLDFEMSLRQFASRCRDEKGKVYEFHDNFMRGSINLESIIHQEDVSYEAELISTIENRVEVFNPQVVIIDNLTYLCMQSESGAEAGALMRRLMEIKNRYGISMLVISHTPKRNLSEPLTENSLAGSKRIANFADSMFAIGKSIIDENVRYIKQIKSRGGEIVHGASNVQTCYIDRQDGLLRFITMGESFERDHLKQNGKKCDKTDDIRQLLNEGRTIREIVTQLQVSSKTVCKVKAQMSIK